MVVLLGILARLLQGNWSGENICFTWQTSEQILVDEDSVRHIAARVNIGTSSG